MALPKLAALKFKANLPSNGEEITYRPFLVKEEKNLLIAMESEDPNMMVTSLNEIVNSCVDESNFDVSKSPFFDSEYLFLQMRARSIGEISTLQYSHTENLGNNGEFCDHVTEIKVNLEEITATKIDGHTDEIQVTDTLKVKMRYPTITELSSFDFESDESEDEFKFVATCLQYVFDDNEIYEADTLEEKVEFIESMNSQQLSKISTFFDTMPRVRKDITYKCGGCGQEDTLKLEGLSDFF